MRSAAGQANAVVEVSKVLEKASFHAATLRDAADQLYHQHNDPFLIRAPAHDVPTALEILQTGGWLLFVSVDCGLLRCHCRACLD